ncbi:MAG: hypothetical protein IIB56_15695 [Planctomycetes bacterium]|nr:hypothetical protein [Planctomycetota bacterium]
MIRLDNGISRHWQSAQRYDNNSPDPLHRFAFDRSEPSSPAAEHAVGFARPEVVIKYQRLQRSIGKTLSIGPA